MTSSMFDQMLFKLACGHQVVVGRLEDKASWICEEHGCGKVADLSAGPIRDRLAHDLDTANQIDLHERAKGATITRESNPGVR